MSTPSDVVRSFIADHHRWNEAARARMAGANTVPPMDLLAAAVRGGQSPADILASLQANRKPFDVAAALKATDDEFRSLLGPYFAPGVVAHPGAVNDPPLHDPDGEEVLSEDRQGDRCVVHTRLTTCFGTAEYELDYEYHLRRVEGRWLLERIVDPPDGGRPVVGW